MKNVLKILSVLVFSVIMMFALCVTANAATSGSISGAESVTAGTNLEYTVSLSGCPDATSIGVDIQFDGDFSLVSGIWLKSGSISSFDLSNGKGALGGLASPNINGDIFKLVLKANTPSDMQHNVSITVIAKNGSNEIFNQTFTKSAKITCSTHSYSGWSKSSDSKHTRTCSVCGNVETANHSWNNGSVTKNATCKESGTKRYTCTACNAEKTEVIPKTNEHSYGKYTVTKEPSCEAGGLQEASCSVCGNVISKKIEALGHDFGRWENSKEATCTTGGEQKRICARCKREEKRYTDKLAHDFTSPELIREATIYSTGLMSGKCKNCGETTDQIIPCSYTDEKTGIKLEASEGVFAPGTVISIEIIDKADDTYKNAGFALSDTSTVFILYKISAAADGQAVQPAGKFKILFAVPDSYGDDTEVYGIGDDAKSQKTESAFTYDKSAIEAEVDNLGLFAICKAGTIEPPAKEEEPETEPDIKEEPGNENEPEEEITEATPEPTPKTETADNETKPQSENSKRSIIPVIILAVLAATAVAILVILKVRKQKHL